MNKQKTEKVGIKTKAKDFFIKKAKCGAGGESVAGVLIAEVNDFGYRHWFRLEHFDRGDGHKGFDLSFRGDPLESWVQICSTDDVSDDVAKTLYPKQIAKTGMEQMLRKVMKHMSDVYGADALTGPLML